MTKYMDKEDIKALELINNEVEDPILKNKLIKIYIQSIIKEKHYRERHRYNQISLDYENSEAYLAMVEISTKQKSVESIFDDQESKKELYKAIHELDVDEQKFVWLFFFCDFSLVEIAKDMGLTKQALSKKKIKIV
ncbi:hypothetical protein [Anaerorhabdus sp.]|uniref:RNA polymerase sigma factor n=1 Tax=Anaerorhabdus sp. TaxID=1872524 RepID=UPI002B1EF9D9|nr:hypothetical protein [Anaerorhabdus sp.]MEA4873993.1 hypothetical protein [Anaerorhabdus sp.]